MPKLVLSPPPPQPYRVHSPQVVNTLVVGGTGCGKSYLVDHLAEIEARQEGRSRIKFDPKKEDAPGYLLSTSDQAEYIAHFWGSENLITVTDECREVIGLHNQEFIAFATRGRRQGHHNWFITQQVRGLSPAVIGECTELFAFRCGPKNAADLVEDFIHPELANCPFLKKYEFYHLLSWGPDGSQVLQKGTLKP